MSIYQTIASNNKDDLELQLNGAGKPMIISTPPSEFGGIDTEWSPEDLFSGSISSCYILTFKFLARMKKLDWVNIEVKVDANLEKAQKGLKFTTVLISPKLTVCCSNDVDPFLELLYKAKDNCLITNSMNCEFEVKPKVIVKNS